MKENSSVLMQDIQFDLGEGLLDGYDKEPISDDDVVLIGGQELNQEIAEWPYVFQYGEKVIDPKVQIFKDIIDLIKRAKVEGINLSFTIL